MILQRIRKFVDDAGFEPETTASAVWRKAQVGPESCTLGQLSNVTIYRDCPFKVGRDPLGTIGPKNILLNCIF